MEPSSREFLRPHEAVQLLERFRETLEREAGLGGSSDLHAKKVIAAILKAANKADPERGFAFCVGDLPKSRSFKTTNYSEKTVQAINSSLKSLTEEEGTKYAMIARGNLSPSERAEIEFPSGSTRKYCFARIVSKGTDNERCNELHIGFLHYPPLIDFNASNGKRDLYHYLFSLFRDEFKEDTGLRVIEQSVASVDAALRLITADDHNDSDHLDCIFGIFETPARIRKSAGRVGEQSAFHAIMHTVSLKAVARADSPSKSFSEITADPNAEFHCVSGEVGAEFVTEILQYFQNRNTLSFDDPNNRIKVRPPVEDLGVLMNELQYHRNPKISRVAFIDGITATRYMKYRSHELPEEDELCFLKTPMPSYGNGIWVRPGLHDREKVVRSLTRLSWKYRMSSEYIAHEEELLKPYKNVVSAIHRPV